MVLLRRPQSQGNEKGRPEMAPGSPWYQEDWYDDWQDQGPLELEKNPCPRGTADEEWGSEEYEEYVDTEEAEKRQGNQ